MKRVKRGDKISRENSWVFGIMSQKPRILMGRLYSIGSAQ